ncbi:carbohydrate-binding family 9-like protein [Planctomycetota bacterium]
MRPAVLTGLLLGIVLAGCVPKKPKTGETGRLFQCRRARGTITLDGKLDEPSWDQAQYLDGFVVPGSHAKPKSVSAARFLWDDENLYFAMVMEDLDVYGAHKEHDSATWEDDVAEVFLKPRDGAHYYYEIHVNPLNTTLDLLIPRRGSGTLGRFTPWESGMRSAVLIKGTLNNWRDRDKGWIVEAAIPLKAFAPDTPKPQLGDRWRFAVCRYDYSVYLDGHEKSSTARLATANFHRHEDYDYVEFAE